MHFNNCTPINEETNQLKNDLQVQQLSQLIDSVDTAQLFYTVQLTSVENEGNVESFTAIDFTDTYDDMFHISGDSKKEIRFLFLQEIRNTVPSVVLEISVTSIWCVYGVYGGTEDCICAVSSAHQ